MKASEILPGTGRGTADEVGGGGGGPPGESLAGRPLRHAFGAPPPRAGEDFQKAASRLAGFAGVAFGWPPDAFWHATPTELAALVRAVTGDAPPTPPDARVIAGLQERFPDG